MKRRLLNLLAALSLLLVGCSGSRFKVIDGATRRPLADVQVTQGGMQQLFIAPPVPVRKRLGVTQADGSFAADALRERPVIFTKPAYKAALVSFKPGSRAWVISPQEDAEWRTTEDGERHLGSVVPTSHFRVVSKRGIIVAPMWPVGS